MQLAPPPHLSSVIKFEVPDSLSVQRWRPGEFLQARQCLALTQEQLGYVMDLSVNTIARIEAGTKKPSRTVELLLRHLVLNKTGGSCTPTQMMNMATLG